MPYALQHNLYIRGTREQAAKQDFVASLRSYVLNDVANELRERYETQIEPAMEKAGKEASSGPEVHNALKPDPLFRLYSSIRYNTQEMVWRSVLRPLGENRAELGKKIDATTHGKTLGSLSIDPNLEIPRNVSAIDVHLAPGSYHREDPKAPWMAGAVYDHGFSVFSFGMMGENHDDIGQSMSQYIRHKYPEFQPKTIIDVGCTIGHNTCAWKQSFPDAHVTGLDVAPASLRYAHARAEAQGTAIDFKQANATALPYDDNSVDVVFSSMFLHELSVKDIRKFLSEANRVLRPGGLMLHMELPPNASLEPYDAFYLDWDAYYNNEPFYKAFRDQDIAGLCEEAGFGADKYLQFITPQYSMMPKEDYAQAIQQDHGFSDKTGRFADGIQWFGFGAWK
jgi:ubiquinone/menaquinone biosynthesis C-methylase UbiE